MNISKPPNVVTRQTQHLAISLLASLVLLSGCQPSDSLSSVDEENNNSRIDTVRLDDNFDVNSAVSAANDDDAFSDIEPSYVEGIADAPSNEAITSISGVKGNIKSNVKSNDCQNSTIIAAFKAMQSDRQVKGCGTIIKVLPDDNKGSRHQKILIELNNVSPRQTLLLVHNIDLAPRVADVSKGTLLKFYGEYVYNNKGGLVHWTHHDPAARHQGGWIDSNSVHYQ